jgi:cell division protein ZapA (FtsZ GTPase activity inhibitor)
MSRQPVRVQIFNQSYSLMADGDPRETQQIAQQVDELMASIADRGSSSDSTQVAVLACLELAHKLRATERKLQVFEDKSGRIANLLEEALGKA